jgi:hypothetical protein
MSGSTSREQPVFLKKKNEAFIYFTRTSLLSVSDEKDTIGNMQFAEQYTAFRLRSLLSEYFYLLQMISWTCWQCQLSFIYCKPTALN